MRMMRVLPVFRALAGNCYDEHSCMDGTTNWGDCGYDDTCVATDGESTGDTVEGYGTWDVGASDPFSHWFRSTEMAPN
eukprot:CAMPEP_0181315062 /NCGR_PEP_ID=MMETSP1101-20121128/15164_1 /TAXON_ID=46948 /ORGANISM="Rhodomonas abbreviata, Strain Caron Lab Isolate" /LENGTH=77 /DNA_ID=CAMNT_0023422223 /DNA_START=38 /DNA_END=271 /DNA_ORIENTATION=-